MQMNLELDFLLCPTHMIWSFVVVLTENGSVWRQVVRQAVDFMRAYMRL